MIKDSYRKSLLNYSLVSHHTLYALPFNTEIYNSVSTQDLLLCIWNCHSITSSGEAETLKSIAEYFWWGSFWKQQAININIKFIINDSI